LPEGRVLRPAAVLAAILPEPGNDRLLLTKRSSALKHHPGQIAFPGGKQDATDANLTATALREAHEEIGLDPAAVTILGQLPQHETVTGFLVTPFVGVVSGAFEPVPEAGEVEEVFTVPLGHVLNPERFSVQSRRWQGRKRHYFTVPFGPYYIWGATARMLRAWADLMT
jgi:8-oxo-dGTP pyrophosphatase MutT (NUDIX family)